MRSVKGKYRPSAAISIFMKHSYGELVDESMCFGIGQGLQFIYKTYSQTGFLLVNNSHMLNDFCSNMGFLSFKIFVCENDTKGMDFIRFFLDKNMPVILELSGNVHFQDKIIKVMLLTRMEEGQGVTLCDPITYETTDMPWNCFIGSGPQFPFSQKKCFPIAYLLYGKKEIADIENIAFRAIKKNAYTFLNPIDKNHGILAIERLRGDVVETTVNMKDLLKNISAFEKSSGLLRAFYADFLYGVSKASGNRETFEIAQRYEELAEQYKLAISLFQNDELKQFAEKLSQIYGSERLICEDALNMLKSVK